MILNEKFHAGFDGASIIHQSHDKQKHYSKKNAGQLLAQVQSKNHFSLLHHALVEFKKFAELRRNQSTNDQSCKKNR